MPLFADEDRFTSLFEGPTAFYVMTSLRDGAVRVPIHRERREGAGSTEWVDTACGVPRDRGTLQQRLRP